MGLRVRTLKKKILSSLRAVRSRGWSCPNFGVNRLCRVNVQKAWDSLVTGSQLDLLEVCAPWDSPLVRAVREAGGRAVAIGIHNGYD